MKKLMRLSMVLVAASLAFTSCKCFKKMAKNREDVKLTVAPEILTLNNGIANEGAKARNITFVGDGTQTVDVITNATGAEGGQLNYQRGSTFTFENVTVQAGEGNFDGIVCDELVYRNCTIKG